MAGKAVLVAAILSIVVVHNEHVVMAEECLQHSLISAPSIESLEKADWARFSWRLGSHQDTERSDNSGFSPSDTLQGCSIHIRSYCLFLNFPMSILSIQKGGHIVLMLPSR